MSRIIDFHCHIYPEKIAAKAVKNIGDFYNIEMNRKGTAEDLIEISSKCGINNMIVHSTATNAEQVESINDFIVSEVEKYSQFIGFGTLHPDYADTEKEIERMVKSGLKGIKIHPDFQMIDIDDEKMYKIYEILDNRLPILFHVGDQTKDFSNPAKLKKMVEDFPKQQVVAAHLGGYSVWEDAAEILKGYENIWVDTCSSFAFLSDREIIKYMEVYGYDKVLFATDFPMWNADVELERLENLCISDDKMERILYKNAEKLLNLA